MQAVRDLPIGIVPRGDTTPAGSAGRSPVPTLPLDLLQQSTRRLRIACLLWVGLWSLGFVLNNFVAPAVSPDRPLDDAWPWPGNPVAIGVIVVSLLVFAMTHRKRVAGMRALDLGLWHEIGIALAIGVVNQWTPNTAGLSWICVLLVTYPVIVPNTPGKILAASLAAASMDFVGLAITRSRGVELPPASVLVWTYLPNYVCAVLALLPSHVITHLGHQVTRARRLGSYQLGELLGRGGMGEVYRATHRMLVRPAAIKLIRPELLGAATPDASLALVERFRREANAAALLSSPHTIDLYDFGVAEDGTLYYVMELLEGVDFDSLVQRFGPLPPERAIHLLVQVCRSLTEAHARGLVHRDIKPANLQACRVGLEVDFVKVFDFGLVRPADQPSDSTITQLGIVAATPAFAAPEVALHDRVDRRADLYSVGCVAYWLLAGRLVFEAENPMHMVLRHARDTPDPPSRHAPGVPAELDAVVLACLAKSPEKRPPDAAELAARLARVPVREAWTEARARAWWSEHAPEAPDPGREAALRDLTRASSR
jgi:serine/threonine-protein kinase